MKKIILYFLLVNTSFAYAQKKEVTQSVFVGYGQSCFLLSSSNINAQFGVEFYCHQSNYGFAFGYNRTLELKQKLFFSMDIGLSRYSSQYYLHDYANNIINYKNNVTYNNLFCTPELSYKLLKWLQPHAGVSVNILLYNQFNNTQLGKSITWLNANGNSRMLPVYPNYSYGVQFNFTKRIKLKLTSQYSIVPIINLKISDNSSIFKPKQGTNLATLYYQLK